MAEGDVGLGWDGYAVSYALIAAPAAADLEAALDLVRSALVPAEPAAINHALGRLRHKTRPRPVGEIDLAHQQIVYSQDLARRGVVLDLLDEVVADWMEPFWPDFGELARAVQRRMRPRQALLAAFERGFDAPEPNRAPPSEEEKRAITELLARHGIASSASARERPVELPRRHITAADQAHIDAELARVREVWATPPDDPALVAHWRALGLLG